MDKKRRIHLRRGDITSQIYSVNNIDPNKLREGYLVWDKATGQWIYRDASGAVQAIGAGGGGDLVGPAAATNNSIAIYDGATGKLLKNSGPLYTDLVIGPATATDSTVAVYDGITGKLLKDGGPVSANIVLGPALVTDGNVALFDGTTGKLIKDGGPPSASTGLEKLTEGATTGYRIIGRDPLNYADIGGEAMDFSYSASASLLHGASGLYSVAFGLNNQASGDYSFAHGQNSVANDIYAFAMGSDCEAINDYSVAIGDGAKAHGLGTVAMGVNVQAIGQNAVAFGFSNVATGIYSTAFGYTTNAVGSTSFACGLRMQAFGKYSFAGGKASTAGYSKAVGDVSFVFQNASATGMDANADDSVILGGVNNKNTTASDRSVILGGTGQTAIQEDIVYFMGTKYWSYTSAEIALLPDSELGTFVFDSDLQSLVQCTDATVAANVWSAVKPTGLERVTDVNTGHRLISSDPTHHGPIGIEAIDFVYSDITSASYGARGNYSMAVGFRVNVGGDYAFGAGHSSNVSGAYAVGFGQYTIATGQYAFVFGDSSSATGSTSFAGGKNGSAKSTSSFCFQHSTSISTYFNQGAYSAILGGYNNLINASGDYSAILGGTLNVINLTADYSVILGGQSQTATQPDMVYLPSIKFKELSTAPATPEPGTMYLDTADANNHILKIYLNVAGVGTWKTVTLA